MSAPSIAALLLIRALSGSPEPEPPPPPATVTESARFVAGEKGGDDTVEALLDAVAEEDRAAARELAAALGRSHADDEPPAVAIVAPVSFFVTVMVVVALALVFRDRRDKLRHETIRHALERGAEIPTELLLPSTGSRSDVRRGLVLLLGGIGFSMMLAFLAEEGQAWAVGLFPIMTGLGYLVYAWLERRGLG